MPAANRPRLHTNSLHALQGANCEHNAKHCSPIGL